MELLYEKLFIISKSRFDTPSQWNVKLIKLFFKKNTSIQYLIKRVTNVIKGEYTRITPHFIFGLHFIIYGTIYGKRGQLPADDKLYCASLELVVRMIIKSTND